MLKTLRLNVEGLVPEFKPDIYEYDLVVPNDINNIEVLAIAKDDLEVLVDGNESLKKGMNFINVTVVNEDKNEVYTIKVTKTDDMELANCNLEELEVKDILLEPPFNSNITKYRAKLIDDVSKLDIFAIPENENAEVEIIGNKDSIYDNQKIIISVLAENEITKREYEIELYKEENQSVFKEYHTDQLSYSKDAIINRFGFGLSAFLLILIIVITLMTINIKKK